MTESMISLSQATFTPSEAEKITGVSQPTQRDWRRRELTSFESRKGRKRFITSDLAHLVVMNQLLPQVRPAVAYQLAGMCCWGATVLLAAGYSLPPAWARIRLDGQQLDPDAVERFAVYCQFMDAQRVAYFTTSELNNIIGEARKMRLRSAQNPVAFYVVVDLSEIRDQLSHKRIKPYFVRVGQEK